MQQFVAGLGEAQQAFGCTLIGGDTDRAPGPLSIAVTVIGDVPTGQMVRRATAKAGDQIFVSGTLGNAALGLRLQSDARAGRRDTQDRLGLDDHAARALIRRYQRPIPRLDLLGVVRDHASAAMDLSDGLVKDLTRMCQASGVGARVDLTAIPAAGKLAVLRGDDPQAFLALATAGDDYEILAAFPPGDIEAVRQGGAGCFARIGTFVAGAGVTIAREDGTVIPVDRSGWDHF
jgi:thiamine-monophosphate kinase